MKVKFRIKKNTDFDRIIKNGIHLKSDILNIHVLKNENVGHIRVGVSASTKLGNAVVRNKIKRQIRALVNEIFDFDACFDVIVIAKKNFLDNEYKTNKALLVNLLKNKERQLLKK